MHYGHMACAKAQALPAKLLVSDNLCIVHENLQGAQPIAARAPCQTSTEIASSVMDSRPASLEATVEARCDRP